MSMKEKALLIKEDFDQLFDAGKQAQYDEFWDDYQENGSRTDYSKTFWRGFTKDTFRPKHSMSPTNANSMFYGTKININLEQHLNDLGITLDFSNATDAGYLFAQNYFTVIPEVNLTSLNMTNSAYYQGVFGWNTHVRVIRKVILPPDGSMIFKWWFNSVTSLEEIRFEGTIGQDINLQWSKKLDLESLLSLVYCLKIFNSTDSGYKTKTVTLSAESWALLDTTYAPDGITYSDVVVAKGWNRA